MNNEKALNWLYNKHPEFTWDMVDFTLPLSGGTYCIYDETSGMAYFGRATNIRNRIRIHKREMRDGYHNNSGLQSAFDNGNSLIFFCISKTVKQDTASLLEAHWANVFGVERVFNINVVHAMVCIGHDLYGSSDECISAARRFGYPFIFEEDLRSDIARSIFSRDGWEHRNLLNAPALEAARKLIL